MNRSIALTFLLLPLALAQSPSPSVTTHIVTCAPAALPDGFQAHYRTAVDPAPFTVAVGAFGQTTPYTGPRDFAIYRSKVDSEPSAPGSKPDSPVATVSLPEGSDVVLILCTRAAEDKVSLSAHSLDSPDLKPGGYRLFNLSRSPVAMTLGDQKLEVAPGKDSILSDPKWHEKPIALPVEVATVAEGTTTPFYSSVVEHYPKSRTLMFCFDGGDPSEPVTFATLDADKLIHPAVCSKR